jgi:membrane protein DedA with SNARE-associated domain
MLDAVVTWLTDTIFRLGYPGIVILMAIESSAIPFPSEVVMPPAGYLAAKGRMSFPLVLVSGISGSLIGALANYMAAKWLEGWLRRHGKWLLVSPQSLDRAEAFFRRHGAIGTFIGRLVPVVRQLISIPAGLARMRLDRFVIYTSLGAGIWCFILTYIGFVIGQNEAVLRAVIVHSYVKRVLVYLLPALALLGVGYVVWYRWRARRRAPSVDDIQRQS